MKRDRKQKKYWIYGMLASMRINGKKLHCLLILHQNFAITNNIETSWSWLYGGRACVCGGGGGEGQGGEGGTGSS